MGLNLFLEKEIIKSLGLEPTSQQKSLIEGLSNFILNNEKSNIFLLKGYAGTGKTTIISALVKTLTKNKIDTILLAPTGRAAKVFANTANKPAYTIHKKIFRIKSSKNIFSQFVIDFNRHKNAVFIVDEASMISNSINQRINFGSGNLLSDLLNYVFAGTNCKIIFSGDTAQLPPVGIDISPALDKDFLEMNGYRVQEFELTQVVRQSLKSGILYNATRLRKMITEKTTGIFPKFKLSDFEDIKRVSGTELIEEISDAHNRVGVENTMIVTRSNKRANKFNFGIRQAIMYKEDRITNDDLIMIVKNNYFWKDDAKRLDFIANGDIVQISRLRHFEQIYDYNFVDAEIYMPDYDTYLDVKLMLDVLDIEAPALSYESYKDFYQKVAETYADEKTAAARLEKTMNDEYLNALQIKFAYAVTCHKAQGGQWDTVFIDQAFVNQDMVDINYLRWLYTALTRATQKVYLVNFKDDFFE